MFVNARPLPSSSSFSLPLTSPYQRLRLSLLSPSLPLKHFLSLPICLLPHFRFISLFSFYSLFSPQPHIHPQYSLIPSSALPPHFSVLFIFKAVTQPPSPPPPPPLPLYLPPFLSSLKFPHVAYLPHLHPLSILSLPIHNSKLPL